MIGKSNSWSKRTVTKFMQFIIYRQCVGAFFRRRSEHQQRGFLLLCASFKTYIFNVVTASALYILADVWFGFQCTFWCASLRALITLFARQLLRCCDSAHIIPRARKEAIARNMDIFPTANKSTNVGQCFRLPFPVCPPLMGY